MSEDEIAEFEKDWEENSKFEISTFGEPSTGT